MTIRCGNRAKHSETTYHENVAAVAACHRGETWACTWLNGWTEYTEDGPALVTEECGALSWYLPGDRGYTCEAGHEHIHAEVRDREGWDYAEDVAEARRLATVGVASVGMDGRPIDY